MPKHNELAIEELTLPTGETVQLVSLCRFDQARWWNTCGDVMYLQRCRQGDDSMRASYESNVPRYTKVFAANLEGPFDAVVSPPSKYTFADPYREALLERFPIPDLTQFLHRARDAKESSKGATFDEIARALSVDPLPELPSPVSLLIVDDIYEGGKTTAALLQVLRAAGAKIEAVLVVAPLRVSGDPCRRSNELSFRCY